MITPCLDVWCCLWNCIRSRMKKAPLPGGVRIAARRENRR